jgi:alcohol dehydrogenase class IV
MSRGESGSAAASPANSARAVAQASGNAAVDAAAGVVRGGGVDRSRGSFRVDERDRVVLFGRGTVASVVETVGGAGYSLLTTPRAAASAPELVAAASSVADVPHGQVDQLAGDLRDSGVEQALGERVVALGGGRVIDVAKALIAVGQLEGRRRTLAAVPTTLSGAEMSQGHRHARGVDLTAPRVRPAIVIVDPDLSASHAAPQLAATSANALAHALAALTVVTASPYSAALARDAILHLDAAWPAAGAAPAPEPDRDEAALGALMAGWAMSASGLSMHHVLAQTVVRLAISGHAEANAALLPDTIAAIRRRAPERFTLVDRLLGFPLEQLAVRLRDRAGGDGLALLASDRRQLDRVVEVAARRTAEMERNAPAPDPDELRAIYLAAARGAGGSGVER